MTLYENIKKRRQELHMSQSELAEKLGYTSKSTISKIESGENDLTQSKVEAFAKALYTTPKKLMGWDIIDEIIASDPNLHPIRRIRKVPILGEIACGDPIWAEENFDGYIGIDPTAMDGDFALYAKGNSMIDAGIKSGDLVLLKKTPQVEDGQIAAVYYDGEATLKKVYMDNENKRTILQPCNTSYAPIVIDGNDVEPPMILGECVGIYHPIEKHEK